MHCCLGHWCFVRLVVGRRGASRGPLVAGATRTGELSWLPGCCVAVSGNGVRPRGRGGLGASMGPIEGRGGGFWGNGRGGSGRGWAGFFGGVDSGARFAQPRAPGVEEVMIEPGKQGGVLWGIAASRLETAPDPNGTSLSRKFNTCMNLRIVRIPASRFDYLRPALEIHVFQGGSITHMPLHKHSQRRKQSLPDVTLSVKQLRLTSCHSLLTRFRIPGGRGSLGASAESSLRPQPPWDSLEIVR